MVLCQIEIVQYGSGCRYSHRKLFQPEPFETFQVKVLEYA